MGGQDCRRVSGQVHTPRGGVERLKSVSVRLVALILKKQICTAFEIQFDLYFGVLRLTFHLQGGKGGYPKKHVRVELLTGEGGEFDRWG